MNEDKIRAIVREELALAKVPFTVTLPLTEQLIADTKAVVGSMAETKKDERIAKLEIEVATWKEKCDKLSTAIVGGVAGGHLDELTRMLQHIRSNMENLGHRFDYERGAFRGIWADDHRV